MATLVESDSATICSLKTKLICPDTGLPAKYRVLYSLRNVAGPEAHEALAQALKDTSALFRHDVAFCLGQRQDPAAIEQLTTILHNPAEHAMVRHEAGEALGAIGSEVCMSHLRQHLNDDILEVAETCQLALQRIEYVAAHPNANNEESPYYSVDPTPALSITVPTEELKNQLLNENMRMFDRYSALFALRNKGGPGAVAALGHVFKGCKSALLKHEVAYVLGQMQDQVAAEVLTEVLRDCKEHAMVRHEAAESLGSIADGKTKLLLKEFTTDPEPIVADSCIVALDMIEYEMSGEFQYCTVSADVEEEGGQKQPEAAQKQRACAC